MFLQCLVESHVENNPFDKLNLIKAILTQAGTKTTERQDLTPDLRNDKVKHLAATAKRILFSKHLAAAMLLANTSRGNHTEFQETLGNCRSKKENQDIGKDLGEEESNGDNSDKVIEQLSVKTILKDGFFLEVS